MMSVIYKNLQLMVDAPQLLEDAQITFADNCAKIKFRCMIPGGDFACSWFRNGTVVLNEPRFVQEHLGEGGDRYLLSLTIRSYNQDDEALYVAKVTNNSGTLRAVCHFDVPEQDDMAEEEHPERMDTDERQMDQPGPSAPVENSVRRYTFNKDPCRPVQALVGARDPRRPSPSSSSYIPAKKVAACSPSTAATQQVAPQIGTIGSNVDCTDSSAEVLSVFECPVCLEYMLPPYLQCHSGHLVCGNCRPKLQCCPTCRGATPNVRNLGLEKIANTVRFPCKFASSGCQLIFYHQDKVEHEEGCEYRPYSCPCPGASCKWQGGLVDVMDHLKKAHKSITTLQGEDIVFLATDINLPGAVDWVMMQSCFGYNFMLVLEKQDRDQGQQMFYAVVQLIGAKKEADNFMYRLELSTMRRRLAWEATPRSIHEGVAHAIQQSDCLAFDTSTAQLFAENGNLGINVTISMANPDPIILSNSR